MVTPLEGTKVVDITEGIAGPYCSMELGDGGADVIKVEMLEGDASRGWGPPFVGDQSAVFLGLNRNKRSIALDWTKPEGRDILLKLAKDADVFMDDLGVGQADKLGFGYDLQKASNPGLVYLSITAFGENGPFAERPGSELVAQAMAEMTASLGAIGDPPVRMGTDAANTYTGYFSFMGVMAALFRRNRSGRGQKVSTSLVGSGLFMRGTLWTAHSDPDEWYGFHLDNYIKPREYGYTAKDGRFIFAIRAGSKEDFSNFLKELGLDHMLSNPHWASFGNVSGGGARYGYLYQDVWDEKFGKMTVAEVTKLVEKYGGNVYPMNNYEMLFSHPQFPYLDMLAEMEHPTAGKIKATGIPWKLEETPGSIRLPPPLLGQHTDEILREVQYSQGEINSLRRAKIVA